MLANSQIQGPMALTNVLPRSRAHKNSVQTRAREAPQKQELQLRPKTISLSSPSNYSDMVVLKHIAGLLVAAPMP